MDAAAHEHYDEGRTATRPCDRPYPVKQDGGAATPRGVSAPEDVEEFLAFSSGPARVSSEGLGRVGSTSRTGRRAVGQPDGAIRPLRVLIVEDDQDAALLAREALRGSAAVFVMDTAGSLAEAFEQFNPARHDVVLLDLNLPDSHGLQTLERVAERAGDVPIVVMTAVGDEERAVRAVAGGAQDYLVKDEMSSQLLVRSVRYAIERSRLLRDVRHLADDLNTLIAHAAHDLRTPIAVLTAVADAFTQGSHALTDDELQRPFASVQRQATKLSGLVDDLLAFAQANRQTTLEAVDAIAVVKRAIRDTPPPDGTLLSMQALDDIAEVSGQSGRLQRIVTNLLTNAYRYGGQRVVVEISCDGEDVAVSVTDDGPGIPEQIRPELFSPFTQGPNRHLDSNGLGLSIVRRLAESLGGSISYTDDQTLGGARFTVRVPSWQPDSTR